MNTTINLSHCNDQLLVGLYDVAANGGDRHAMFAIKHELESRLVDAFSKFDTAEYKLALADKLASVIRTEREVRNSE